MWRCKDGKMGRCEDGKMGRCGDAKRCEEMWRDVEMLGGQNLRCRGFIQRQNTGLESCTYAQVLFLKIINTFAQVSFVNLMPLCKIIFFIIICTLFVNHIHLCKRFFCNHIHSCTSGFLFSLCTMNLCKTLLRPL